MNLIKLVLTVACHITSVHCTDRVRDYFASFDFNWDAMSMFLTTETWFNKAANSGLTPYLTQERIRPSCRSFLNSPEEMGGALLAEQFRTVSNCLQTTGIMDYTSDEEVSEREAFKVNLGKTACRMTNLDGCTRNVRNRVFFPNNASTTCSPTNTIRALAKVHNAMSCIIDMNAA